MDLSDLLRDAGSVIQSMIGWVGNVIGAIFNTNGDWHSVSPFLFIGLGITLILTAVGVVRSFVAGRNM